MGKINYCGRDVTFQDNTRIWDDSRLRDWVHVTREIKILFVKLVPQQSTGPVKRQI